MMKPVRATLLMTSSAVLPDGTTIALPTGIAYEARNSLGAVWTEKGVQCQPGGVPAAWIPTVAFRIEDFLNLTEITWNVVNGTGEKSVYIHHLLGCPRGSNLPKDRFVGYFKQQKKGEDELAESFCQGETLPSRIIGGYKAYGCRTTASHQETKSSTKVVYQVVREEWTSIEYRMVLLVTTDSPWEHMAWALTDIKLGEPDPRLFELPAGYRPVDLSQ
jgi:hypothetical protein